MKKTIVIHLQKLLAEGEEVRNTEQLILWSNKVSSFIKTAINPNNSRIFENLIDEFDDWAQHAIRLGHIQGLIAKEEPIENKIVTETTSELLQPVSNTLSTDSIKVFVVHGHDNETKESTARFLEKIGLQPVILHEQPNSGRTVIEKFEVYARDIVFAVVLLTPDDIGSVATEPKKLKKRARQNVVMELGYFMGKLGRMRVCALHKGDVELPSDYQGVLYIEMDHAGAWKSKLAQEFVQAKLPIKLEGLIGG